MADIEGSAQADPHAPPASADRIRGSLDHDSPMEGRLPEIDSAHEGEVISRLAVRNAFEPRFTVRDEVSPDYGCDGSIELKSSAGTKRFATNRRAPFQLKHVARRVVEDDGSITYPLTTKNIGYLAVPLSFYLLHSPSTNQLFFRWQRQIVDELNAKNPRWREQRQVNVRFSKVVNSDLLDHISIEINAYYDQVQHLRDGPAFIRTADKHRLLSLFRPCRPFVPRPDELSRIRTAADIGVVIPIVGAPNAGKTELLAHWMASDEALATLQALAPLNLAVLLVDLGPRIGDRRVLRALSYALGVAKLATLSESTDEAVDHGPSLSVLLSEILHGRLSEQRLVCVFENADECLREPLECRDVDTILGSASFRDATTFVVSHGSLPPDGGGRRKLKPQIRIGPLSPAEIAEMVRDAIKNESHVATVLEALAVVPEFCLPGIVSRLANHVNRRIAEAEDVTGPRVLDLLDDAAGPTTQAILNLLDRRALVDERGQLDRLGGLIVLALAGEQPLTPSAVAKIPVEPLDQLMRIGWLVQADTAFTLTLFGRQLLRAETRRLLTRGIRAEEETELVSGLSRLLNAQLATLSESGTDEFGQAVEGTLAWLRSVNLEHTRVFSHLAASLLLHVVDDLVFPFAKSEASSLSERVGKLDGQVLSAAVAELVLAVRTIDERGTYKAKLVAAIDAAVSADRLTSAQLRALDKAAQLGYRRFRESAVDFDARRRLASRLVAATASERSDAGFLKWSTSWLLTTGANALAFGQTEVAAGLLQHARAHLELLPEGRSPRLVSERFWLESRLEQLAARIESSPAARQLALRRALAAAFLALEHSDGGPRWSRFVVRSVDRLAESFASDADRTAILQEVVERYERLYGSQRDWSLFVRSQVGALIRDIGLGYLSAETRLATVRTARDLLLPGETDAVGEAEQGDPRALLVLARTQAALANCLNDQHDTRRAAETKHLAIAVLRRVLPRTSAPEVWELLLRSEEERLSGEQSGAWYRDSVVSREGALQPALRMLVKQARDWLPTVEQWERLHTRVALWCLQ